MKLRHRFLVALMASLAVHLTVLSGPAWLLPALDEWLRPEPAPALEARLLPREAVPSPVLRKAQRPRPDPAARPVARTREAATTAAVPAETDQAPVPTREGTEPQLPTEALARAPDLAEDVPEPAVEAGIEAIALPRHIRIRYRVTMGEGGFVIGQASHDWRHDGRSYWLNSTAETTGLAALFKAAKVTHISEGDVIDGALRPRSFRIERDGMAAESARFDWDAGRVLMSGGRGDAELKPETQDMMSMFGQLALMKLIDRSRFSLSVATGKKVETYEFAVLGIESIQTPLGERQALHLRTGTGDTEVWLSHQADTARLPLKIRHVDKRGGVFDQLAESIEFDDAVDGDH